jgi:hypothetical protein
VEPLPDEFSESTVREIRQDLGSLVFIPEAYWKSELRQKWCDVSDVVALRKALMLQKSLELDSESEVFVGNNSDVAYQIMIDDDMEKFIDSAIDLPYPNYKEYIHEPVAEILPEQEDASPGMAASKDQSSRDHLTIGEGGVLICRHLAPRESLCTPSILEIDVTVASLMSTRITYIKYMDGTTDLLQDQWTGLDAERSLSKPWDKLFSSSISQRQILIRSVQRLSAFHRCLLGNGSWILVAHMI